METNTILLAILVFVQQLTQLTAFTFNNYIMKNTTTCFGSDKTLNLTCKEGEMIYIHQVYYGYSAQNQCHYRAGDCIIPDQYISPCTGRKSCQINLPPGKLGPKLDGCKQYSNYLLVRHACIPDTKVVDICSKTVLTAESGFIKTPSYPHNYPSNTKCTSSIHVHPRQQIKLYILDFNLQTANRELGRCQDDLYIQTNLASETHCGIFRPLRHQPITRTLSNQIKLTFETDGSVQKKGFWLYYQAYPPIPTTTPPPREPSTSEKVVIPQKTQKPKSTESPKDSTVPEEAGSLPDPEQQRLPIAEYIVGAVIGVLFIVVVVLLIILVMQRKKVFFKRKSASARQAHIDDHMLPSTSSFHSGTTSIGTSHLKSDIYHENDSFSTKTETYSIKAEPYSVKTPSCSSSMEPYSAKSEPYTAKTEPYCAKAEVYSANTCTEPYSPKKIEYYGARPKTYSVKAQTYPAVKVV